MRLLLGPSMGIELTSNAVLNMLGHVKKLQSGDRKSNIPYSSVLKRKNTLQHRCVDFCNLIGVSTGIEPVPLTIRHKYSSYTSLLSFYKHLGSLYTDFTLPP